MSNLDTFASGWSDRARSLSKYGIPLDTIFPILHQDLERVKQGNSPLNDTEAIQQVLNRMTGKSMAGEKERKTGLFGTLGNIVPNIGDIAKAVASPQFFKGLWHEAQQSVPALARQAGGPIVSSLLTNRQQVPAAIEAVSNPSSDSILNLVSKLTLRPKEELVKNIPEAKDGGIVDTLKAAASAPVNRLVPGSYIVPRLLSSEGRTELQQHPAMAILDVLPYAGKIGKVTAASKLSPAIEEATKLAKAGDVAQWDEAARLSNLQKTISGRAGFETRQAAKEAFPNSPVLQALGGGRPVKALSRAVPAGLIPDPILDRIPTVSDRLSKLAGKANLSELDRNLSTKISTIGRKEVSDPTQEAADAAKEFYKDLSTEERVAVNEAAGFRKVGDQNPHLFSEEKFYNKIVDDPNTPLFRDPLGEARNPANKREKSILKLQEDLEKNLEKQDYWSTKPTTQHSLLQEDKLVAREAKLATKLDAQIARVAPARFHPAVEKLMQEKVVEWANDNLDPESAAKVVSRVQAGLVPNTDMVPKKVLKTIRKEAESSWQGMKEQGLDPVFQPIITPNKAQSLASEAFLVDQKYTPSLEKPRTLLSQIPSEKDPIILRAATAREYGKKAAQQVLETDLRSKGHIVSSEAAKQTVSNITEKFRSQHPNATADWKQWESELLDRMYADWTPESYGITGATRREGEKVARRYADALSAQTWKEPSPIVKGAGKVQRIFKTSALLSATYPINNLLGNVPFVAGKSEPKVLLQVPRAAKAAFDGFWKNKPSRLIPADLQHGMISNIDMDAQQAVRFNNGSKFAEIWNRLMESKVGSVPGKGVTRWFDLNARFDTFFRALAYFDKEAEGMAPEQAIRYANEVISDMDDLTPLERNVIKQVIPFYSFQRHVTRYALRFPADHPIRTQLLSGLTRQMEEEGTLPDRFKSMFWLGSPDSKGEQWRLDSKAMNPFYDFADNFTFDGFMSNASPFISAPAKVLGISDLSAAPTYTNRTYDPETGRFVNTRNSSWKDFALEFLPQLSRTDRALNPVGYEADRPNAPFNLIKGTVGVPGFGVANVDRESFLNESARQRFANEAVQKATRDKDYSDLERIPGTVFFRGMPMPASLAARIIRAINNAVKNTGWEGAPSAIIPPRR